MTSFHRTAEAAVDVSRKHGVQASSPAHFSTDEKRLDTAVWEIWTVTVTGAYFVSSQQNIWFYLIPHLFYLT